MTIKIKKRICVFLCIYLCIFALNIQSYSADGVMNWYLKYKEPGEQPDTPDGGKYLDNYDVISIDKSGEKTIYLTFDVGFENGNVTKILDALEKHKVKGAFFVLPNVIRSNPELITRMKDGGHLICNHTRSHKNMGKVTDINEFKKELYENEQILKETLGLDMEKYYRPPEGAYSELNLKHATELGYTTVFWSLAYADWDEKKQPDPDSSLNLLLKRVHPGCVALLHPTSSTNAAIIDRFITELKIKGYVFRSLDEFPTEYKNKDEVFE